MKFSSPNSAIENNSQGEYNKRMAKERFKITPSVYLVLMKENKILLSRRYNTGFFDNHYSFPAGHLDGEETLKQAMVREAKEETGIVLDAADLELIHTLNRKIPGNERVDFFFTAEKWQGEPQIMELDKCDDLAWFELDNLPKNIIPYIKQAIDSFLNDINYSEREGEEIIS
jgi:mutator protein MutT